MALNNVESQHGMNFKACVEGSMASKDQEDCDHEGECVWEPANVGTRRNVFALRGPSELVSCFNSRKLGEWTRSSSPPSQNSFLRMTVVLPGAPVLKWIRFLLL